MFGSVAVVKDKPEKKSKKDKKKSKKDKKKKRKRGRSSSDSSSGRSTSPPKQREGLLGNDDELMAALFGNTPSNTQATPAPATRAEKFSAMFQKQDGKRSGPRDSKDMIAAGLGGRFTSSGKLEGNSPSTQQQQEGLPPGSTPLKDLVSHDGKFQGMFVPEHLRDTTLERWQAMLKGVEKPTKKKQKTTTDDRFTEYEGIGTLMSEVKHEKTSDLKRPQQGAGSLITYGTERFSRDNVIAFGRCTLLMLPVFNPITKGHCYITTVEHRTSEMQFDDDEAEEVRNFKKCLMQKADAEGCEMVFSELAVHFHKGRQAFIECIPMPKEECDDLEIRFYKAIDESESVFAQSHKRVISTKGQPLKSYIPPNIPYYHVCFGLTHGYAHVVANEKSFPTDLTAVVCGETLQLGMSGRLSKADKEKLLGSEARKAFRAAFEPHDWTKMLVEEDEVVEDEE